mgnify:CR=1 FL=1
MGFVYDLKTFAKLRDFDLAGEGWSITHDNANLILLPADLQSTLRGLFQRVTKNVQTQPFSDREVP